MAAAPSHDGQGGRIPQSPQNQPKLWPSIGALVGRCIIAAAKKDGMSQKSARVKTTHTSWLVAPDARDKGWLRCYRTHLQAPEHLLSLSYGSPERLPTLQQLGAAGHSGCQIFLKHKCSLQLSLIILKFMRGAPQDSDVGRPHGGHCALVPRCGSTGTAAKSLPQNQQQKKKAYCAICFCSPFLQSWDSQA